MEFTARVAAEVKPGRRGGPSPSPDDTGDRGGSAPSRELALAGEPAGVADLGEQIHGVDHADPVDGGQGAAEPFQEGGDVLSSSLMRAVRVAMSVRLAASRSSLIWSARLRPVEVDAVVGQRVEPREHPAGAG